MQNSPKPWLPPDAFDPAMLAPTLTRALSDWSKHWFANDEASAGPAFQDDWPAAQASTKWRSIGTSASVALSPIGQSAVASAMLGCTIPQGTFQSNDRAVIESLATSCADDLLKRIGKLSGEPGTNDDLCPEPIDLDACGWWDIMLKSGKRAFKLAIASTAQVRIVKNQLPAPAKPKLKPIARGLAEQKIDLTADLGRCSIRLSELEDLGVGDILILDRSPTEPIELLIDGFASPFDGMLESVDGQTCVVLDSIKDHRNG